MGISADGPETGIGPTEKAGAVTCPVEAKIKMIFMLPSIVMARSLMRHHAELESFIEFAEPTLALAWPMTRHGNNANALMMASTPVPLVFGHAL